VKGKGKVKELISVKGHFIEESSICRGKRVRPGIFVEVTGKTEEEKDKLFELAREEIGKEGRGLDCYEIIKL